MRPSKAEPQESRRTWGVPLLALILVLGAMVIDPMALRGLRNFTFDQYQRWHPRAYDNPPVRIIDIDDESLRRIGQWPWSRDRLAQLLDETSKLQPASIAIDIVCAERDRNWQAADVTDRPDPDAALAQTLARSNVAIGFAMTGPSARPAGTQESGDGLLLKASFFALGGDPLAAIHRFQASVSNLPELQEAAAGQGAMTFLPDVDGIIRKVPLLMNLDGRLVPSLAAEALRLAAGASHYTVRSEGDSGGVIDVRIGKRSLDTDASGSLWIHYSKPRPERSISAWKILAGEVPADAIKGNIVLVGTSAQGLMDLRFYPLGGIIPGVEVHAQALEQVLAGQPLSRPGWTPAVELLTTLVGGLLVGVIAMTRSAAQSSAGFFALAGVLGLSAWQAFIHGQVLIDPSTPILGLAMVFIPTTLMRHLLSERRQRWMKQTFSRYVSPNLVEYLVAHPGALNLGGRRQQCSFVFTDLAGFTALMETMDPTAAVAVLNAYLDRMIAIAFENDGTLDRIVGDAVAIVFSAPIEQADHQQRALRCALQMHSFARDYMDQLLRQNIPFCETRIGVHTGEVTVGNFGGDAIFDYRALGDAVNIAARLEGANKHLGTLICVSEATLAGCPGVAARPIGQLRLSGRSGYVMAYEPLLATAAGPASDPEYQAAFDLIGTDRNGALAAFTNLAIARPKDPLVNLHLDRLQQGKNGIAIEMTEK
ncbi:adenylate/guanylate cyclase domain-containing protein [Roseateles sp.]|uniref:CHASE2 domain-containing protein n=1 Tax=Roseateles sp. TaxID=1971397 RepID=UPI00286AB943|nr:adenylate/guanylate cyclase domain-containing protein [Roseateles sp.]